MFSNSYRGSDSKVLTFFLAGAFGALIFYLGLVAFRIRIEGFDTYTLLSNARALAGPDVNEFYWKRFIFLPLLLSPFYALERLFFNEPFAFVAGHLLSVLFYAALVGIFYRWLLLFMGRHWALGGAWLLALNPLLIHYAPFIREDIPAAFFTTLAFYFYWKSRAEGRGTACPPLPAGRQGAGERGRAPTPPFNYGATAVALSAAMATRYNLMPLLWAVIGVYEMASGEIKRAFRRKIFYYFVLPLLFFLTVPALAYGARGLAPWSQALFVWIRDFLAFSGRVFTVQMEPPLQNYLFIGQSMTWPVLAAAFLGFAVSVRRKAEGTLLHSLWFLVFFAFHTYAVSIKEARYLFPLFPALYFFAARGLEELDSFLKKSGGGRYLHPSVLSFTVMLLLFFLPVRKAVGECLKFRDPVYATDFAGEVSRYAKGLSQGNKIYWFGPYYALHPREYLFHPDDEFTYIYHMYNHVIRYYARQRVIAFTYERESQHVELDAVSAPSGTVWFVKVNIVDHVADGDVLILNPEPKNYSAGTAPEDLKPLVVERVRKLELELRATSPEGFLLYAAPQHPAARMVSGLSPQGFRIEGADLPFEGPCEIHPMIPGALLAPERVEVSDGKFVFVNPALTQAPAIPKIVLLCFDGVREFDPESMANKKGTGYF